MANILVTGGSSGLGELIVKQLREDNHLVFVYDIQEDLRHDVAAPNEAEIADIAEQMCGIDILINCAGTNKIGWLENFSSEEWDDVVDTNAKGIFMMTKALLPHLRESKGTVLNIVSNAAHMPMRCSSAYNASKGAALILSKQLARELISDGITVFSISPNKLRGTGMSEDIDRQVVETRGWTMEEAQAYQLAGLLTGEETDPAMLAEFIGFLLSSKERHKALAGCDLQYGL